MKKITLFQQFYQEILEQQNFRKLDIYLNHTSWTALNQKERKLLAELFILRGEKELLENESNVLESFTIAQRLVPDCPKTLYSQAKIFIKQRYNIKCWNLAKKALEQATLIDPEFVEAWHSLANVLVNLGLFYHQSLYFIEALSIFKQAFLISKKEISPQFFWHWGLCWYYYGKESGEAIEFKEAIDKFQEAADLNFKEADFWQDYGNAFAELGHLIDQEEFFYKAIDLYQQAVEKNPDQFEAWLNIACILQHLYEIGGKESLFNYADSIFLDASKNNPLHTKLWLKWGLLLAKNGKLNQNPDSLKMSFEKFAKAYDFDSTNTMTLSRWAEAQMLYGALTEQVIYIKEAREKILKSLELSPDNSEIWSLYGTCLYELGHYFNDKEFYLQSIEKYQYALSVNRHDFLIWYGLALSYFALSELTNDTLMLEKTIRLFSKIEKFSHLLPQLWNDWGVALMKLAELNRDTGLIQLAVEKFEKIIKYSEFYFENDDIDLEWIYNYGCSLDYLGEQKEEELYCEQAVQVFQQALLFDSTFNPCRYSLALAYFHIGELKEEENYFLKACEEFQLFLINEPEDAIAWNDWGLTLINLALLAESTFLNKSDYFFAEAEAKLLQARQLGSHHALYSLACLYSLLDKYPIAIEFLEKALRSQMLPSTDDLLHDDWLEGLRQTSLFREFLNQVMKFESF